jgi:two-component system, response regulator
MFDIILIEDNPMDADLILRALKASQISFTYLHLRDGEEAMDYLLARAPSLDQSYLPKLILLDLKLPKLNGLEILKAYKAHGVMKIVPILIFTSSKAESDMLESYRNGANGFVVKPIDFTRMKANLKEIGTFWLTINQLPQ